MRCCLVLVLATVVTLGAGGWLGHALLSAPNLGPGPAGADHGDSLLAIATWAAADTTESFITGHNGQATVTLSEHDLTVLARATNPHPDRFRDPHVRVRAGLVVVDAVTDLGPLTVTGVGRLALGLTSDNGAPDVGAEVREIDAGTLTLPGFARDSIESRVVGSIDLAHLLAALPGRLRAQLDCVRVAGDGVGVVLGFHAPGVDADPSACRAAATA